MSLIEFNLNLWFLTFLFCTVPVYDGRKRQLKIPDELRDIPKLLKRYVTKIPQYSLALVAYTASSYTPAAGARQDQLTANLHIQFAVVLYEPDDTSAASGGKEKGESGEEADSEAVESETAESDTTDNEAGESEADDSEAAESDAAESEAVESN